MWISRHHADVIKRLRSLPGQTTPEFPGAIRALIEDLPDPENILSQVLSRDRLDRQVRFCALYGLLLRLRREERHTEYEHVVARYGKQFDREPYFATFRAIAERNRGDVESLRKAVRFSRQAANDMPDVAGVVHQLAVFMAEYFERKLDPASKTEVAEAERHVDKAIILTDGHIAHYHETKARILAIRRDFDSARVSITRAIELEPRSGRDYYRRLTQYQTTRTRIDLMEQQSRWNDMQETSRRELVEFRAQQLQLLGLLAAVVALIATGGNIASQSKPSDAIVLIEVMAGAVVIVFSAFSLMTSRSWGRILVSFAAGIALVVVPHIFGR
ncbi:tetratricopeptide repeat protein [Nonomuraea glycinis]|uniref:tetratricopeptide repeat protein n=1 Tax=Nonomuraea glycinis TaxID=2047744 RepID=UPI002E0ED8C8|nr:hypothetical protein OHA68_33040 [Nonomuraea glycinis]